MTTLTSYGLKAEEIHRNIDLLTNNLINIKDTTGEFLLKLDDGRIIDTKGWDGWEWTHGIGLYGLYHYRTLTNSPATLQIIQSWFDIQLGKGTTKNINTMSPFLTLAYLYEETRNPTYLPWLDTWAEWLMHGLPRTRYGGFQHETYNSFNKDELWDDTLMMSALPLAKIGLVLKRQEYVDEAKRQFMLHCQYLFDTSSGLFFHGWKFHPKTETKPGLGHNFARARWARGNSWLTIAIPDFIELLDLAPTDPLRLFLLSILDAQCRALRSLQSASGLWNTLLDIPVSEGSYEEASATAGFAYGMLKAVRKRYVGAEYLECAVKAIKAVLGKINQEGELLDVSFGTAMGHTLQHYKDIKLTSMPYGQAMAIMALGEFLRTFI
ncbi:glycoside hydrolase family 105 protein [Lophiostoma macrostomum CBS 122681]|uniref:Glycoside hydrolase family 105 protein n=1 Tax=Lophiostoma macrostomum CBS 122681 TaxID=1314788 RepID=A0A6A6SIJ1_9PLEO|nr:glycoside hydrolase family 105 protein [Lophiostoma macrostomum CBS 122681]